MDDGLSFGDSLAAQAFSCARSALSHGSVAGQLGLPAQHTVARAGMAPLPLEELQQLAAVFGMVKTDYVEPVDEKKLITDAISGMVASLDPHSSFLDARDFQQQIEVVFFEPRGLQQSAPAAFVVFRHPVNLRQRVTISCRGETNCRWRLPELHDGLFGSDTG